MDPEGGLDELPKLERKWEFEDPAGVERRLLRRQVMVWIAAVSVLVMLGGVWVRTSAGERARNRAYRAAVEADMARMIAAQQGHFGTQGRFASLEDLGIDFISSQGVRVRVDNPDSTSWSGAAWHLRISYTCAITIGSPNNPDQAGPEPSCR